MVAALGGCLMALTRDIYAARASAALFEESAWSKYAAVSMAAFVLLIVSMRFERARDDLVQLNLSIGQRIAARELELQIQHERVSALEREQAVASERNRILRDMHDGAGANLIAAIHQIEGGEATRAEVLRTLSESLDQLRLSVDAMHMPDGDINALLANLRFRLDRRIRAAGLQLVWHAAELPSLAHCTSACMRHIQFILMEAISNVMQHAQARTLSVVATATAGCIQIALRDDGVGMDGRAGNGLRTMNERAAFIGAGLTIEAAEPGTIVCLTLPLTLKLP